MNSRSDWRHAWLPLMWLFGVGLCLFGTRGPSDPAARRYGVNWPGDLRSAVLQLSVETIVLYIILRPWSYAASWVRALSAFLLFAAWTVLGGLGTMHSGLIDDLHWAWLLLVSIGLFGTTIISSSLAIGHRERAT